MSETYLWVQLTSWENFVQIIKIRSVLNYFGKSKQLNLSAFHSFATNSVNSKGFTLNFEKPMQNFNINDVMYACNR